MMIILDYFNKLKKRIGVKQKYDFLQPYMSDCDFNWFNVDAAGDATNGVDCNFYVFVIRYRKIFRTAQPIKVQLKFCEDVPAGVVGCALA